MLTQPSDVTPVAPEVPAVMAGVPGRAIVSASLAPIDQEALNHQLANRVRELIERRMQSMALQLGDEVLALARQCVSEALAAPQKEPDDPA